MSPSAIERLLLEARAGVARVRPEELAGELAAGALVVDTRPFEQRRRDGALPGAVVIDRNVLEWRLDPTSPDRIAEADATRRVVVVCSQGYSSSLAARTLRDLGVAGATDLVGGHQAWAAWRNLTAGQDDVAVPTFTRVAPAAVARPEPWPPR